MIVSLTHDSASVATSGFWILFGIFGWCFPRYMIHNETTILNKRPPYQMISDTVIVDFQLNHSLVDPPTVDNFLLRSTAVYFPFILLVLHAWYAKRINNAIQTIGTTDGVLSKNKELGVSLNRRQQRCHRVASVVSSFSAAIGLSEGFTVMIKLYVQRRRPNFYDLCGFDPNSKQCAATIDLIREANFSFPSGHSSLTCCGMTFLVWYMHGNMSSFQAGAHQNEELASRISSLLLVCLPLGWTLFVAASRLVDHWHHPSDVIGGLILGFVTSTIAYHNFYPPIWSSNAGIPRSLLPNRTINTTNVDLVADEDDEDET